MDFRFTPAEEEFRDEIRTWLAEYLTDDYRAIARVGAATDDEHWDERLAWEKELAAAGWLGISWPKEYGGRGGTLNEEIIFLLEHGRAGAPYWVGFEGRDLFGPTLLHHGSDEQKKRFLPAIMSCEEFWGQGYSEPDAGSDLASLKTRAVLDGDEWVIEGQKIWMSAGTHADWLFVLCRTDPSAAKHKGISLLLIPADQPGVDIRPIRTMAGAGEFCEAFFTGARTSADLVVGGVNDGWRVAMGSLPIERFLTVLPYHAQFDIQMSDLLAELKRRGRTADPLVRQRLAGAWIGLRILWFNTYRTLTGLLRGGTLGPESSLAKLYWGSWHRDFANTIIDLLGAGETVVGDGYQLSYFQSAFLNARAETIYGGAHEIQRTIVGERVLGLPKEPG